MRKGFDGFGDVVAIQGLGGLGHLGVQFAKELGFKTVAISRGQDKQELARKLGAHAVICNCFGPCWHLSILDRP